MSVHGCSITQVCSSAKLYSNKTFKEGSEKEKEST
jgi:hypothetical protein